MLASDKTRLSDAFLEQSHELDQLSTKALLFAVIHESIYGRPKQKHQLGRQNSSVDNTANSMLTIPL